MLKLGIALVWFVMAAGLYLAEPELHGKAALFAAYGKWFALAFAIMNLLRPSLLMDAAIWILRKIGVVAPLPKPPVYTPPVRPVVRPELDFTDDRIQSSPPSEGEQTRNTNLH